MEMRTQSQILRRPLRNAHDEEFQENESAEKETTFSIHSVESGFAVTAEKVAACMCKRIISISGRMGKSLKSS